MGRRASARMGNSSGTLRAAEPCPSMAIRWRSMYQGRTPDLMANSSDDIATIISELAWAPADLSVHPVAQVLKLAARVSEAV